MMRSDAILEIWNKSDSFGVDQYSIAGTLDQSFLCLGFVLG